MQKLDLWSTFQKLSWWPWNQKQIFFTFPRQFLTNQGPPPGPWICYSEQWRKQNTINRMRHLHQFIELHMRIFWEMHRHFCRVWSKTGQLVGYYWTRWVFGSTLLLVFKCDAPSSSVGDSSIEVEVSHVFGRFLRSAHLLIVEDDPPTEEKGF